MKILFKHGHLVVDGNKEYLDGALLVEDETILEVFVDSQSIKENLKVDKEIDLKGQIVMPGFFDTHTHGVGGVNFSRASEKDLDYAAEIFAKHGTTSFLTSLTNNETITEELEIIEGYKDSSARLIGIHFEGPFINSNTLGMLNPSYVYPPDKTILSTILSKTSRLKQMTIAPELDGSYEIIEELHKHHVNVMVGHTKAIIDDLKDKDYQGFTHLFNRCTPLHHRDIGVVNVAFSDEDKYSEVIADGKHIDKNTLRIILKNIPRDRLVIVSDSMELAGLPDGECVFEGEKCIKKGLSVTRVKDGVIAGGACFINDGLKNMYELGAKLTDILLMSSLNAYRLYHLDQRFGSLVKGKYADIVIMDEELNVTSVYCKGQYINV